MSIPSNINSSGALWIGWSYLKFEPIIPPFQKPSGEFLHVEAYKLLPNYGLPTSDFAPIYNIDRGGVYPAMSRNNVFNVYLNITWSSRDGDAQNA